MFSLIWLIRYLTTGLQPFEQRKVAHGLGLWGPDMREHWVRLQYALTHDWSDIQHAVINLPVEWARLDPQRAVKVGIMDQAFFWFLILLGV